MFLLQKRAMISAVPVPLLLFLDFTKDLDCINVNTEDSPHFDKMFNVLVDFPYFHRKMVHQDTHPGKVGISHAAKSV